MARQQNRSGGRSSNSNGGGNDLFLKQLRAMDDAWDQGKQESAKPGGGGTTLSNGDHVCTLTNAEVRKGDKALGVLLEFTNTDETSTEIGEKAYRWCGIGSPEQMVYTQRDLRRMMSDPSELDNMKASDLPALLKNLLAEAPKIRIRIREKEGNDGNVYQNVYIQKRIADDGEGSGVVLGGGEGETGEPEPEPETQMRKDRGRGRSMAEPEPEPEPEPEANEPEAEPEPEPEPDDDQIEKGDSVVFTYNGSKIKGEVVAVGLDGTFQVRDPVKKLVYKGLKQDKHQIKKLAEVEA